VSEARAGHRPLSDLLQYPTPTFIRLADTGSGLLHRAGTDDGDGIIEAEIHLAKRPKVFRLLSRATSKVD
jgi:hypothetical protein